MRVQHGAYGAERCGGGREHHQRGERAVIESQAGRKCQRFSIAPSLSHRQQDLLLDADVPEQALAEFSIGLNAGRSFLYRNLCLQTVQVCVLGRHELIEAPAKRLASSAIAVVSILFNS